MKHSKLSLAILAVLCTLVGADPHLLAADETIGPQNTAVARENYADLWYVSQSTGSDTQGDGSQSKPWKTVEKALAAPLEASAEKRSAILVAEGKYSCKEMSMREHVDLFGGFEPSHWERDSIRYPTILAGKDQSRILLGADHARLDGFVIQGATVRGDGAALLCDGTSPAVTNNRFQNNRTLTPPDWQPKYLHEKAHDGAAICARNGAAPRIANNLFVENHTEIGRGAAIAFYSRCEGTIRNNVFLENETGVQDAQRSSDGGAVSIFDWSKPRIENNLFIENQALATNDGGALFVALWSSPRIVGNTFVGNKSADDGGALFIGGQEHRYDRDFDPLPQAEDFSVDVSENLFSGDVNSNRDSGGIRITMQSRARLVNNILAEKDQLYIQASEVHLTNNTFLEDMTLIDFTPQLAPRLMVNNIMWGNLEYETETPITFSNVRDGYSGHGNFCAVPQLEREEKKLTVTASRFDPTAWSTTLEIPETNWKTNALVGRVVESDKRWSIIKNNEKNQLVVWGDLSSYKRVNLMPTYRLQPQSPCIDRGLDQEAPKSDIDGDRRPVGRSVDVGADEFDPDSTAEHGASLLQLN